MWADRVSGNALQTLTVNRSNTTKLLPLCQDVHTLYSYVKQQSEKMRVLVLGRQDLYPEYVRYVMCEMTMFNRKRGGEVQRLKLDDLENCLKENGAPDEEVAKSMTVLERKLCDIMKRVEFRGKFGLRVAMLLTPNMSLNIKTLIKLRQQLGIQSRYLFCRPSSERPYRGADCLRECLLEISSELKQQQGVNWTSLRKHMATMAQVMEMSDVSQDHLARFMGHDIRVHRSFYTMPLELIEKTKVCKVLIQVNEGKSPTGAFENMEIQNDGELQQYTCRPYI